MKRKAASVILVIAASLVGGSCGTQTIIREGPADATRVAHPSTNVQYNKVVFLDTQMQDRIEVQRSSAERTPTNTVEVYVVFRNRTTYRQQIECRVQFFDINTVPIGEPSAWQRVYLEPNEVQTWREASLSDKASYYYVEVREGRR